ncbi:MAG: creatininase family protein [Candidatus Latescibacterota bacterium]|jgi:creatinine amidohydrolase/Fe(II)-dependent formamide hydrolase-like protein
MRLDHEVRWEHMFPHELEEAFAQCPAVYFAYGICEPHGPQNTLGLDALKAHGILVKTAQAHGGIVAPPDYWHVHEVAGYATWARENVGEVKPWLTAIPPWIHFKNICYHVRAAEVLEFRSAIFLTGHYGPNWRDLKTVLEKLQPYVRMRLYGLPDFEANEPGFDGDGASGDHAGKVETSLLWAIEADCVDIERVPKEATKPLFAMGANASDSDPQIGARMVEDEVRWLGAKKDELVAVYDEQVKSRLQTFDDVECFWRDEIRPIVKNFESLKNFHTDKEAPTSDSRWYANSHFGDWG